MSAVHAHLTPARAATAAALAGAAAGTAPTLLGFYVSVVAVAVLLGAAFAAYLAVVDDPCEWAVFELGACAVAALLALAGASLRFPAVVAGTTPWASTRLGWLALAVAAAAAVASLVRDHMDELWSLRDAGAARLSRRIS
jgi:hypothetical protein